MCVCVFTCPFSRAGIKDAVMVLVTIGIPKLDTHLALINQEGRHQGQTGIGLFKERWDEVCSDTGFQALESTGRRLKALEPVNFMPRSQTYPPEQGNLQ